MKCPVILAGMNEASGPKLAAVTNAGGLGGHGFAPKILKLTITQLKDNSKDESASFGDLNLKRDIL